MVSAAESVGSGVVNAAESVGSGTKHGFFSRQGRAEGRFLAKLSAPGVILSLGAKGYLGANLSARNARKFS